MSDTTLLLQLAKVHAPNIYKVYASKKLREIDAKVIDLTTEMNNSETTIARKNQITNALKILNDRIQLYKAGQENKRMDERAAQAQTNIL